jgi:gamma-glutamylcysteine synthetase
MKWRWNRTMLNLCGIVVAILKMATGWIDSRHWTISTGCYFQNGHHNIAKIQHCTISSQFDMWVDNDVPNWFSTLNNFYRSHVDILRYCGGHFENSDR